MDFLAALGIVIVGASILLFAAGRLGLLEGKAPPLGVHDGRLEPPRRTPNSVSSQAALYPDAPQRDYAAIDPLPVRGDGAQSLARLRSIVAALPRARIIEARADYLYAQFTSAGLRFVDDTEFWFSPAENTIHVRSASRLGRRDFQVNRKRVEMIRAAYLQ
ncbi:MAG TPA: DUF1499 domain-containing protein [Burkholderiaceae bacterium]|nr:DUF1499 domain-containing protein [Burkholderiaceae bacterium]